MNKLRGLFTSVLPFLSACDSRIVDTQIPKERVMNIYANTINDVQGVPVERDMFQGKVTLVVNLASQCGLTPQYEDLQELHDTYVSKGFSVVGFPCNDFGRQEPGDATAILLCATGFGANFPIMEKVSVLKGEAQSAVYSDLYDATGALPEWNFGKYLVNRNGTPVAFFGSRVGPASEDITARIEELLDSNN